MSKGDIVLTTFPFTNLSASKLRPVVVLTTTDPESDRLFHYVANRLAGINGRTVITNARKRSEKAVIDPNQQNCYAGQIAGEKPRLAGSAFNPRHAGFERQTENTFPTFLGASTICLSPPTTSCGNWHR